MDDERDEIPSELRAEVLRLVEETYPRPGDHPEAERWSAYRRGRLAEEEVRLLEEHLVRCRDCFDLLQAIDAFDEGAESEDAAEPGAEVAATALSRLVLQQAREAPAAPASRPWGRRSRLRRTVSSYLASAAVFALAALGAVAWRQHQDLTRLRAPQANPQIVYLGGGERAASRPNTALPGPLTLVLLLSEDRPAYDLVIREAVDGRAKVALSNVRPNRDLALSLSLPVGLPPGSYRIELRAPAHAEGPPIEEFPLRIEGRAHGL